MAKILELPEQRIVLRDISWETYERLLADNEDRRAPRFIYDRGALEIISPSAEHEMISHIVALLVEVLAEEMDLDVVGTSHTTFKREDLERGFEADSSFYIRNAGRIRGKTRIDLTIDPSPDLVIEIDITSPSLDKFPIYAQIGIPEVWRYDGERMSIHRLEGIYYAEVAESDVLPSLNGSALSRFIEESTSLKRPAWLRKVREWVRSRGEETRG